jgi:hypothetical protein
MIAVAVGDVDRGEVLSGRPNPVHDPAPILRGERGIDQHRVVLATDQRDRGAGQAGSSSPGAHAVAPEYLWSCFLGRVHPCECHARVPVLASTRGQCGSRGWRGHRGRAGPLWRSARRGSRWCVFADGLAGGQQSAAGALGERLDAHRRQHVVGGAQLLARIHAATLAAQPLDQTIGVAEQLTGAAPGQRLFATGSNNSRSRFLALSCIRSADPVAVPGWSTASNRHPRHDVAPTWRKFLTAQAHGFSLPTSSAFFCVDTVLLQRL